MGELTGTLVAPFVGVVLVTLGAGSGGGAPLAVTEKSSIAMPWSLPVWSTSFHRSQISWPLATVTERTPDLLTRLAAALPSSVAAAGVPNVGLVKSSGS